MTSIPLRRRLFWLAAAGVVPLALMAGVSLLVFVREHRLQAEQIGIEITRALSTAVDSELRRSSAALETLATSPALDVDDPIDFRGRAERMLAIHEGWSGLVLADRAGRVLFDTRFESPSDDDPEQAASFREVVTRARPAVSELRRDRRGDFHVLVSVPVTRDGEVHFVLAAALEPEAIVEVVRRQRLPHDWVVSVFDQRGLRVARSRGHREHLGGRASPSLGSLMARGGETGSGVTHALEGDRIYTAYSRLADSGWSVAIGIPPAFVEAGERDSLAVLGAGLLLSIGVGLAAAVAVARSIAKPMAELRTAARALGGRQPIVHPETRIEEIRQVSSALVSASEERARAEREREELLVREREARAAAEAASRAKDEFLAMLGHELRNPIGAIANASQVLGHPGVAPASAERARRVIGRQVDHLAKLMDDLLDAGRAILGKIVLSAEPIDLAAAIGRVVATLRAAGQLERHPVATALESVWVEADPTRLEQIATNLLTNAVRYTPPGGAIRVTVRAEGADAVLRVADEGIGMSPDLLARAFDLFVQGDQQLDRAHGGLGIGLTLVRRLAELQGGSAVAESAGPGRGTEVVVRLPSIPAPEAVPAAAGAEPALGCDVLLVEDNPDAREMLRVLLELGGHRVRTAEDGEAGVALARTFRPEVMLVDLGLPKLDGYEVARRIWSSADGERPFLVALTGYGLAEDRERALAAGFDAHVVKPADGNALREVFARARARRLSGTADG